MKLLQSLRHKNNVLLSPLSVASALSLATLGTTPSSQAQKELLDLWHITEAEATPFFKELDRQTVELTTANDGVQLLSATSVWCKSSIKPAFSATAKDIFKSEAHPLPSDPAPINAWVKTATSGMVPSIIDQINPLTVAMAVSAVFFKGVWAESAQFDKKATIKGTFQSATAGEVQCAMMQKTCEMPFAEDGDVQVVQLPYGSDGRLVATALLPAAGALDKLVEKLADGDAGYLATLVSGLQKVKVALSLPRFKLEFGVHDVKKELESTFGVKEPFHGIKGFLAMSDDPEVHLENVFHKAVVEVNEEGTKAGAATAAVIMTRSMPEQVVFDRPFVFLIRDSKSGLLLFAGAVADPQLDTTGV